MDNVIFTRNDYKILKAIIDRHDQKKGLCKRNGTTIKELVEKTSLSDKKIRQTLKIFEELKYIEKGLKIEKAYTFVLTEKGFKELNNLRMNIFEEV